MAATRHVRLPRTVCKCENSSAVNLRNVTMSCGIHPTFHHILPSHSLKFSLQKHPGTNKPTKLPNISTRFASCSTHAMPCPSFTVVWLEPRSINMPSKNSPKVNGCPSSKSSFPGRPMGDLHCLDSTWGPTSDWITLNVCKQHMSDDHTRQRNINFPCNSYLYSLLTSCVKNNGTAGWLFTWCWPQKHNDLWQVSGPHMIFPASTHIHPMYYAYIYVCDYVCTYVRNVDLRFVKLPWIVLNFLPN